MTRLANAASQIARVLFTNLLPQIIFGESCQLSTSADLSTIKKVLNLQASFLANLKKYLASFPQKLVKFWYAFFVRVRTWRRFIPQIDDISHKIARRALLIFRIAGAIINGYVAYCSLPRLYAWLDEIHEALRLLNTQLSTLMARM